MQHTDASETNVRVFARHRAAAVRLAQGIDNASDRKRFAEAFSSAVIAELWRRCVRSQRQDWMFPEPPITRASMDPATRSLSTEMARVALEIEPDARGYLIGTIYARLLPLNVRTEWGVYYTPPPLVQRLLSNVTDAGLDWAKARIVDPACGGAAFLAPVAHRIWRELARQGQAPKAILEHIAANLIGVEIDAFSAWMSQVLTQLHLLDLSLACSRRLPPLVRAADSLRTLLEEETRFDLVVGNPPYGRTGLTADLRTTYARSVYGHANSYGLFTDLSLRIANGDGIVAFVTPASFLSGQYFKALRAILAVEAPPRFLDFVHRRAGVFEDVLQDTVLVVFSKKHRNRQRTNVSSIDFGGDRSTLKTTHIATCRIEGISEAPWRFPRTHGQRDVLRRASKMKNRLRDYGLTVSTGQLVWNRHKDQLRSSAGAGTFPLVWAESVLAKGKFRFQAKRASHKPFVQVPAGQDFLVTSETCVLVQRTTAKEQGRRLNSAVLPQRFIREWAGVVVENHLNLVKRMGGDVPSVPLRAVCALLNSQVVDEVFRCISGSVAVSAYELDDLPLPSLAEVMRLDSMLRAGRETRRNAESFIASLYGCS